MHGFTITQERDGPDKMHEKDVLACQFGQWFPAFESVTFKTKVLTIPEVVVQYFLEDGMDDVPQRAPACDDGGDPESSGWDSDGNVPTSETDMSESDCDNVVRDVPTAARTSGGKTSRKCRQKVSQTAVFKEFEEKVNSAIKELGGGVLPKLNWSSPKDAIWMSPLQCNNFADICMLFKASDYIEHDLTRAFELCSEPHVARPETFTLVLRSWHESINPASEFRCFVRHNELVGISQRDTATVYPHLVEDGETNKIVLDITRFYQEEVRPRQESWAEYGHDPTSFVFDVYVDLPPTRKVWLIDIAPCGEHTKPLLFDWDEFPLKGWSKPASEHDCDDDPFDQLVDFRVVKTDAERQARVETFHCVPQELAELAVGGGMQSLAKLIQKAEKCNAATNAGA